jgi:predicted NAD/FAD-binding protein
MFTQLSDGEVEEKIEEFDVLILACQANDLIRINRDLTQEETKLLEAFQHEASEVVVHTDDVRESGFFACMIPSRSGPLWLCSWTKYVCCLCCLSIGVAIGRYNQNQSIPRVACVTNQHPSIHICKYTSIHLCIHTCIHPSMYPPSIHPSIHVSILICVN